MSWRFRVRAVAATAWFAVSMALAASTGVQAWGRQGHELIADIAESELAPDAAARARRLLAIEDRRHLREIAAWADTIRLTRPETGPWHYVNVPIADSGYEASRHCPQGRCIVNQLRQQLVWLGDCALLAPVRLEALKWVVHLVGDIHQPLHVGDNGDRGGNDIAVTPGGSINLHAVWDSRILERMGGIDGAALLAVVPRQTRRAWSAGDGVRWLAESHRLARDVVYPLAGNPHAPLCAPLLLPADHDARAATVVREQLVKAGLRLAGRLNEILPACR